MTKVCLSCRNSLTGNLEEYHCLKDRQGKIHLTKELLLPGMCHYSLVMSETLADILLGHEISEVDTMPAWRRFAYLYRRFYDIELLKLQSCLSASQEDEDHGFKFASDRSPMAQGMCKLSELLPGYHILAYPKHGVVVDEDKTIHPLFAIEDENKLIKVNSLPPEWGEDDILVHSLSEDSMVKDEIKLQASNILWKFKVCFRNIEVLDHIGIHGDKALTYY